MNSYQYLFSIIIGRQYRVPIIRESRYSAVTFYGGNGTESYYHQGSWENLDHRMIFSGTCYVSPRVFYCHVHGVRYYDLYIPFYRICIQQYYRGFEITRRQGRDGIYLRKIEYRDTYRPGYYRHASYSLNGDVQKHRTDTINSHHHQLDRKGYCISMRIVSGNKIYHP